MIRAILFDLDGTLIESTKHLHFVALNEALAKYSTKYVISDEDHHVTYDGLSTRQKLKLLTQHKQLPEELYAQIEAEKQQITKSLIELLDVNCGYTKRTWLYRLKKEFGLKIGLCTNSIPETTQLILNKLKLHGDIFDIVLTNFDVVSPKPSPEIYLLAQQKLGVAANECLIVEDSDFGITSGLASGAFVFKVNGPQQTRYVSRAVNCIDRVYPIIPEEYKDIIKPLLFVDKYSGNEQSAYFHVITCPDCGIDHSQETKHVKRSMLATRFSGRCSTCSVRASRISQQGKTFKQWVRRSTAAGYIQINVNSLSVVEKETLVLPMVAHRRRKETILEHRLIMAREIGRPLLASEIVHHLNGIKTDNRIENLELLTLTQHHSGHGDVYYQKWQESEKIIKELTEQLRSCKCK